MIQLRGRLRDQSFPELLRLQDAFDRERVWMQALKDTGFVWVKPISGMVVFGLFLLVFVQLSMSFPLLFGLVFIALFLGTKWSLSLLFRRRIRRSIRQQLRERGMRICLECGYNLTGNTSGMCPECAAKVEG